MRISSIGLHDRWQSEWTNRVNVSGKGRHLMLVKYEIGIWPWLSNKVRVIETAMARLRVSRAGVNAHLHRFGMKDTSVQVWGVRDY